MYDYWKSHNFVYAHLCQQSDVSFFFFSSMLSRLVRVFLPRNRCHLIPWLQSLAVVTLESKKCHHGQNCPKEISFLHVIYNWNSFYLSEQAPTWGSENLNLRLGPDENEGGILSSVKCLSFRDQQTVKG